MFARYLRLPSSVSVSHGLFFQTDYFSVKLAPNTLPHNRYGFVVSKKVDKRAVVRNRVKRRVRACVEQLHSTLQQGSDMVFVIKRGAVEATTEEMQTVLSKLLDDKLPK